MHCVQIYKDYAPIVGGIENHVRDLSQGLLAQGHQVTVLVSNTTRYTQIEYPEPGLTIIKAARIAHAASTPISPMQAIHALKLRAEIVHLHFPFPPGDLIARALPGKPKLVVTYHSDIVRQQGLLRAYRPLMHRTLTHAQAIIATSQAYVDSSEVLQQYREKCRIIPLGIDTAYFAQNRSEAAKQLRQRLGIAANTPTTLFVGRLRYYKGLHILLDAVNEIHGHVLIGGDGPQRAELEAQAQQLGIAERVHFLGDVSDDDLPVLYQTADVFVMPAHLRAEALGISQIEALASGTPSVSTELGTGTSFVNRHCETGFVVPPNNPRALAKALNVLLTNPELRQRMGQAGQQRMQSMFDRQQMIAQNVALYQQILN